MSDHSKRTRSQLSHPEEFSDVHFGISPLRAARLERRKNLQTDLPAGSSDSPDVGVDGDESDDELLLSPPKTRPPKRQPLSQQPGFLPDTDQERQYKRLKQDHNDEHSHLAVSESKQPSGPFDFSAINPELLLSCESPGKPGASSRQRAHTVPFDSPVTRRRDLGQLMPSPEKASIVPPLHEVLRFSSVPRSLGPSTDAMNVDNPVRLTEESERHKSPERLRTPTPPKEQDSSFSFGTPITVKNTPTPNSRHQSVASGLEIMTFSFTQLPAMAPRISPDAPDSDVTPKPIKPPSTSPIDVNPIPLALGDPPSLSVDPPSPLSTLSSMSDLDPSPPPHESEIHAPNVELPSGIPRAIQPPSSAPLRDAPKDSGFAPSQAAKLTTTSSRGRGGRGSTRPFGLVRSTRSASVRKQKEVGSVDGDISAKPQGYPHEPSIPSLVPTKRPSDTPALARDVSKKKSSSVAVSHKRAFSFAMPTSSSLSKTTEKAPASSPLKPLSLSKPPSSIKPASSLGPGEPPHPSKHTGLSNLSLALEKLKIPAPLRPATTLGFTSDNRFVFNALDAKNAPKAKDDSAIRLGHGLPSSSKATATPMRRAVTVGPVAASESNAHASGSGPAALITPRSAHPTDTGPTVKKINLHSGVIVGKNSLNNGPRGFMFGGVGKKRPFEKVSKKSSLPVVEGSPVKASGSVQTIDSDEPPLPSTTEILAATLASHKEDDGQEASAMSTAVEPMNLQDAIAEHVGVFGSDNTSAEDGQAEPADMWKHASRRASLASQFLQQTLAVLPSTPPPKATGSKSKAAERSQFSSQRTRSGLRSDSKPDDVSSRSAQRTLPNGHTVGAHVSRPSSTTATSSSLKVLKSCTIFVDVRTDDGEDAGGLFVDMLKGLGAKIIGRAGQSCTHIVYKNGLMSTLTKYRLMREPKPVVVGISWVVECVEKCRRVGEENFLVDLDGLNVAGNNKRRRSMLPKHISLSIQARAMPPPPLPGSSLTASDQSIDGADLSLNSSDGPVEDEDDIPPLERARQRRNIFFKS